MPDALFDLPRLAQVYDLLDPDRRDLDAYVAIVDALGARSVLDIACGTGTFACLLAGRDIEVVGVDPAGASLDVARRKACATRVRWIHGDATTLPDLQVDLATMTGNAAQVFVTDPEWAAALDGVRAALRPGGSFVFESRDPRARAWSGWDRESTRAHATLPDGSTVESWVEVLEVREPLVSFRTTFVFSADGAELTSDSTLRFRDREELEVSLTRAGFAVHDVRDAPDRPGLEMVFVTSRRRR